MTRTVAHLPRPARLATAVLARWRPAGIPPAIVTAVLRGHGLTPTAEARNLDLSRRSHNVVVATDDGPVVVKQYRSDWTPGRVEHVHAVLGHLQDVGSPVPRLRRRTDGATVTTLGGRTFAVMDLVEGRNVSLDWMTRADRLRAAMVAGRVLARLHHDLTGFEPAGDHHLGFTSLQGPPRRPLGWYLDRLHVLSGAAVTDAHGPDAAPVDLPALARLAARGGELADRLASLDRQVQGADLPRLVIHGDFGLHNLVFTSPLRAVAVDFELARIDWRLTDLVLAVGRFGRTRTSWNPSDVAAFLAAYTRWQPLLRDELAMLGNVWATVRLCSTVRAWDMYARTGATHHLHAAQNAIGEVDWLDRNPARLQRLAAMATVARPPVGRPGAGRPGQRRTPAPWAGRRPVPDSGPRVMLVTPNLDLGGAQATVRSLAAALPRAGCPVVVCTFRDGPLGEPIRRGGVPVAVLPDREHSIVRLPSFVVEAVRRRRDLVALVDRHDVDVVVTFALGTWELLVLTLTRRVQVWWRIGNVAFTLRPEHLPAHRWLWRPKRVAHRWLRRLGAGIVDGIIAVSDDTATAIAEQLGIAPERITVVANGVDVDTEPVTVDRTRLRTALGAGPDDHVMTMVGTLKPQKGHADLLAAVATVAGRLPRLQVWLVGDGALRSEIEAQVVADDLAGRVHLLGSRTDVPALLAASDSFVLPSRWEGMSVALLEAMAAQLPIIATAVSGTTQVLRDGVDAWVVPSGDVPALAAAVTDVVTDPVEASARATAARERVTAAFSTRRTATQLRALFDATHPPSPTRLRPATTEGGDRW